MKLINAHELAELLGLSYQTVQTYVKRGQWEFVPPPIKIGNRYRWNVDAIVIPWLMDHQIRFEPGTKAEPRGKQTRA